MGIIKKPNNNCRLCKCLHNYSYFKKGEYYWTELGDRFFAGAVIVHFGDERHDICSMVFLDFFIKFRWEDSQWE